MNKPLPIAPLLPDGKLAVDTPNPFEGEMEAQEALRILNAIKWANGAAQSREGFAALQKLLDGLLPTVIDHVETARRALAACRLDLEGNHE
ncbi:hypothetical protein [Paraburkholderia caribensis]|uniref:hypothetical protein n=1 Tax=Paraburkholderia caribensis TaxID=75105 RepID=UPI0031DD5310